MDTALTADQILAADDRKPMEFVATPEWANGNANAGVWVRVLSAAQRDAFETTYASEAQKTDVEGARARMIAMLVMMCACDQRGTQLFTSHQIDALAEKAYEPLMRVFHAALAVNGMNAEETAKN